MASVDPCLCWPAFRRGEQAYPPRGLSGEPHIERLSALPVQEEGNTSGTLLGNWSQFCRSIYHGELWEADAYICLHAEVNVSCNGDSLVIPEKIVPEFGRPYKACSKSQTTVIARLAMRKGTDYVARYTNCLRGNASVNVHAEEIMIGDKALLELLHKGDGVKLQMYMSYQPCHHSSGRLGQKRYVDCPELMPSYAARVANRRPPRSCVKRLQEFLRCELTPRNVTLEIIVADLYKVAWTEELMTDEIERGFYGKDATRGHVGLQLLQALPGVKMRAMTGADWEFLVSLCDPAVRQAYYSSMPIDGSNVTRPFTRTHKAMRAKLDAFITGFLQGLRCSRDACESLDEDWLNGARTDLQQMNDSIHHGGVSELATHISTGKSDEPFQAILEGGGERTQEATAQKEDAGAVVIADRMDQLSVQVSPASSPSPPLPNDMIPDLLVEVRSSYNELPLELYCVGSAAIGILGLALLAVFRHVNLGFRELCRPPRPARHLQEALMHK